MYLFQVAINSSQYNSPWLLIQTIQISYHCVVLFVFYLYFLLMQPKVSYLKWKRVKKKLSFGSWLTFERDVKDHR